MGQALVNPDFSIKENKAIFVLSAYLEDVNKQIVPAVAQGAMQAGDFVAKQIIADQKSKPRQEFKYNDKGSMATIGRSRAIASISGFKFAGFFAWFLWGIVHIMFIVNFRNKLLVFIDWIASYITPNAQ